MHTQNSYYSGEMDLLKSSIVESIRPNDIPLAPSVDLMALKKGDSDPLEVVVEIVPGESTRGWDYQPEALKAIVKYVQEKTLNGFLGHQKAEDVNNEFKPPVTHWVGAMWKNNMAYFRGVVDAAASDLKRWIRARRIKQVSIFGMPKLVKSGGCTKVIDYTPLSIDWTPLDRAGMQTRIIAIGEMNSNDNSQCVIKKRVDIHTGQTSNIFPDKSNRSGEMDTSRITNPFMKVRRVSI